MTIGVDDLRIQVIDEIDGALDFAILDRFANVDALVEEIGVVGVGEASLSAELLGSFFETLFLK